MNQQPDGAPPRRPQDSPPAGPEHAGPEHGAPAHAGPEHAAPWAPPRPVATGQGEVWQGQPFAVGWQPARRPRVWPIPFVIFACFCIYIVVSLFALVLAANVVQGPIDASFFGDGGKLALVAESPLGMAITVMIPQLALTIPALLAAAASPVSFRQRLGLTRGNWPIWLWLTAAMATPLVGLISSIIVGSLLGESESLDEMARAFRELGKGGFLIPLALMIGITPGVCEELVFRGYMQTRLNRAWGAAAGILSTSVVFAAFHMDLVHSVAVVALGVYLGWIAWASGSVLPAMFAHFLNNFLSVLAVVLLPESVTDGVTSGDAGELPGTAAAVLGTTMLLSGLCLILTLRHGRRPVAATQDQKEQLSGQESRISVRSPNQD